MRPTRQTPVVQTQAARLRRLVLPPDLCRASAGLLLALGWLIAVNPARGGDLPSFDFTQSTEASRWQALHDLAPLEATATGLVARITGSDPYFQGPFWDYPADTRLWLRLRLKSDQGGMAQVFYFRNTPSEPNSVRFDVPPGVWHEAMVPLPALGPQYRLRIDPPGDGGSCVFEKLWIEARTVFDPPPWPKPEPPVLGSDPISVQSGPLKLLHSRTQLGGFRLEVNGQATAIGHGAIRIGYLVTNTVRWMDPQQAADFSRTVEPGDARLDLRATWTDPDGGHWIHTQAFAAAEPEGSITVESTWTLDRDREVLYLPTFMLLPGVGTHGTNKNQALFAGLEYLENEPSSSEADLIGPAAWRLVPDSIKVTFPLMAIQAGNHYLGLIWEPQPDLCAVHDSPDRQFDSGGHLLGLLFPGSDGVNREENRLLPYRAEMLRARQPLRVRATLIGGRGQSVVPAIQHYVQLKGWPALPPTQSSAEYFELAARGWLESKAREGDLYRHAVWPGFNAQPAADAALWMFWLAQQPGGQDLAPALTAAAREALQKLVPANYNTAQIGHNRYPLPALVFGGVIENVQAARERGRNLLRRFEPDGAVHYQPPARGPDYGKTHWAPDANGLTATVVFGLLEAATFSGDPDLVEAGIRHLRALGKFRNTVPRGAQTWEIPLHTPDILASAYLVHAYALGYELTGDPDLLDQARYWAWTGVPFVYLTPPTPRPVGIYGTIAVLGATAWNAPVWIGQPVQWCGLVYAEAINRLAAHDAAGPWRHLADGIAAAGIQHTWTSSDTDRQGLLPDYWLLRPQRGEGPAINPATLLTPALRKFDRPAPYTFRAFRQHGLMVHAPGELTEVEQTDSGMSFTVRPWFPGPSRLLVTGARPTPVVRIDGQAVALAEPHQVQTAEGRLVLQLEQTSRIEIHWKSIQP